MHQIYKDFFKVGKYYLSTLAGQKTRRKLCTDIGKHSVLFVESIEREFVAKGKKVRAFMDKETILLLPPNEYTVVTRSTVNAGTLSLFETVQGRGKDEKPVERLLMTYEKEQSCTSEHK